MVAIKFGESFSFARFPAATAPVGWTSENGLNRFFFQIAETLPIKGICPAGETKKTAILYQHGTC